MCFTKHKHKKKNRIRKIYSKPPPPKFTTDEVIQCYFCKYDFSLESNQIKIHCAGCNQFFHCNIAGKCIGKGCETDDHKLSWCKSCVPKNYFNMSGSKNCICYDCIK